MPKSISSPTTKSTVSPGNARGQTFRKPFWPPSSGTKSAPLCAGKRVTTSTPPADSCAYKLVQSPKSKVQGSVVSSVVVSALEISDPGDRTLQYNKDHGLLT